MKTLSITKNPKFILLSLKKNILPFIFCAFTICLVIFSKSNLSATKSGLLLWANNVIPSLFPFFIATELLGYTNVIQKLGKFLNPVMRFVFNVPGEGSFALLMGIISGYPIGAKIVTNFRENGICNKEECERLLAFTNNSGPLFIIGTVGISLYYNSLIGFLLFITHLLACLTVGFIFRFWKNSSYYDKSYSNKPYSNKKDYSSKKTYTSNFSSKNVTFSNLGEVLAKSITSATSTILMIGGFIVLFSVILSILQNSGLLNIFSNILQPLFNFLGINNFAFSSGFISGIIELTNGVKQISIIPCKSISTNIIVSAFLLGFGGFSILLQVLSITSKTDISIKPYIIGKLLHGIFAALYTYIFISYFPIFNLNL